MPQPSGDPSATWGYLCVIEHADQGIFGGYLLVNELARPLEFHCTTPVKPTRAQEILYGAALISYLYGERIGRTLVEKASRTPTAILVDDSRAATVGEFVELPVVSIEPVSSNPDFEEVGIHCVEPHAAREPRNGAVMNRTWDLGGRQAKLVSAADKNSHGLAESLRRFAGQFDMLEPFERIRQAIEEARRYPTAA